MATEEVVQELRGTVGIARKISDGNFGSYDFSLFLPVPFDPNVAVSEQGDLVSSFFELAKELIAVQTAPLLAATVVKEFTPAAKSAPAAAKAIGTELRDGQASKRCRECKVTTPHWDNRETKRNPKAPDYKCTVCGTGIWPPKEKEAHADDVQADEVF